MVRALSISNLTSAYFQDVAFCFPFLCCSRHCVSRSLLKKAVSQNLLFREKFLHTFTLFSEPAIDGVPIQFKMNFHTTIATPFGYTGFVYQKSPFKIIKTILPCPDLETLLTSIGNSNHEMPSRYTTAGKVAVLMQNYFHGIPIPPPWELMKMEPLTELQVSVLHKTADIPYGHQKSYKEIAAMIGRPKAFRFVGTTLSKNPFPILIPCHRVIKNNGSYGKFGGGIEMKKKLIEFETARKAITQSDQ